MIDLVAGLPRELDRVFSGFIDDLAKQVTVSSVGLFGSYARGEVAPMSDFDLLVVTNEGPEYETKELVEYQGYLMDIVRVPVSWIKGMIQPKMDYMLHETQILYDPSGVLQESKNWVDDRFRSPGRVEIRTEQVLSVADTYLSRVSSSVSRNDLDTAMVFVDLSFKPLAELLMDLAGEEVTRSGFLWGLRNACWKLEMPEFYGVFTSTLRLVGLESSDVGKHFGSFGGVWRKFNGYMRDNAELIEGLHEQIRDDISYRASHALLGGVLARIRYMIDTSDVINAEFNMRDWMLPIIEDYVWMISAKQNLSFDHPALFKVMRDYEGGAGVYNEASDVFNLWGLSHSDVRMGLERSREMTGLIRGKRMELIERFIG